jgi:NTE family protein
MKRILLAAALVAFPLAALADDAGPSRPKIGIALSGGGAKGCAHVGVLRQLEAMHVPIDYIAGTSMGAIVGALYASGMTPDEIEKELATIDWDEALSDATAFQHLTYRRKFEEERYPSTIEVGLKGSKIVLPSGIRTGQKLAFLLSRYLLPQLDERDFTKLPIPYAAVASDLETGDPVVLINGDFAEAVRASMSIPGAFIPVERDGKLLVDGGVTMNVPVTVVRAMGADVVIAVDIASPLSGRESLNSTLGVLGQLSSFLTRKNMEKELAAADVVLSPDVQGYDIFAFGKAKEIAKKGDDEAIKKRDQLIKYAIDPAKHAALVKSRYVPRARKITIDEIRVEGLQFVDERFVRAQMKTQAGETLDLDKLQKDLEWMYGWNDFTGIHASLDSSKGKETLVIHVQEKPWGPAYVRTGLGVETRYNNPGVFLLLNYTRRWMNERGAEWRNDVEFGTDWGISTEFYQPRGYDKYGFFAPYGSYTRRSLRVFPLDAPAASAGQYDIRQTTIGIDGGVQLHTSGEARVGLLYRWNDAAVEIGLPAYPTIHESEGAFRAGLDVNTTNSPFFPIEGVRLNFEVLAPLDALGAKEQYIMTDLRTTLFESFGRHVFSGGLRVHDSFSGEAPIYDQAILGGLANLSGYPLGGVVGQAGLVASLGYRNRVTKIPGLSDGVYLGAIAEAGDAYDTLSDLDVGDVKSSGTFYVGVDTTYGPLVLAIGKARHRDIQYYIQIGRSF